MFSDLLAFLVSYRTLAAHHPGGKNSLAAIIMKLLLLATAANALRATPRMSVAVFGATGLTGRECTHQLLERGVPVRALCRDPSKLLTPLGSTGKEDLVENDQLYKYKGSAQNQPVLRRNRAIGQASLRWRGTRREILIHAQVQGLRHECCGRRESVRGR